MFDLQDIRSLSDFQRNAKAHLKRLAKSRRPEVLTVNGQAKLVVQDAAAYQEMMHQLDVIDSAALLQQRIRASKGRRGIPADQVLAEVRNKLGLTK